MGKGQISFDFILALIMVTIFAHVMVGFSDQFQATQNLITIRAQEKQIALDLASIIDYSKIIGPATSSEITYKIPKIYVGGKRNSIGCAISIEDTLIVVAVTPDDYDKLTEPILVEIATTNYAGSHTYYCGDIITLEG